MTPEEFSNAFDVKLNSNGIGTTVELDEYEKSYFLTEAQNQLVIELYSGRTPSGISFEGTEELRTYLRELIKTATLSTAQSDDNITSISTLFKLPTDLLFIVYEHAVLDDKSAGCKDGGTIEVVPVTYDNLHTIRKNPFRRANERRALRIDRSNSIVEIMSKYKLKNYTIRYLSKPGPIILANLDNLTIDGRSNVTKCSLNSEVHPYILDRAVSLAIASRVPRSNNV